MKYTKAQNISKDSFFASRKFKKITKNILMSIAIPLIAIVIAQTLASLAGKELFKVTGNYWTFAKGIVMVLVAALALSANLNSGRMDFSLGATGILASLIAANIIGGNIATMGNLAIYLLLTVVIGMILGLIGGIVFIFLKLPPIVTSLGMCLIYEGIAKIIVGDNNSLVLSSSKLTASFMTTPVNIIMILVVVVIVMSMLICYSRFGYNKNALVYDQKISVETGIKEIKNCIACYLIAGALIGLYQFMDTTSTATVNIKTDLASSMTIFKNFLPIFIGGILAKYSNQIIGLLLAVFSTQMLVLGMERATAIGFSADVQSLITGFMVFAVLVYMVDKMRFINWVKMKMYLHKEKSLNPKNKEEGV